MLIPGASTFFQIQKDHEAIAFIQPDFTVGASKQNHPITKSASPHSPSGYTIPEELIFCFKIVAGCASFYACCISAIHLFFFHQSLINYFGRDSSTKVHMPEVREVDPESRYPSTKVHKPEVDPEIIDHPDHPKKID
eukprot:GHVP01014756.1.p1 GENE.GHVP01014756.1~~GHVP01014756.1.p1  ORF type:complete len:137 (+),score=12.21 GHVP01014756.1:34-444(+)